ncbi:peptidoglycan-binding protein [Solirubrobacter sp. CPCC 204708]|uniref:Peptidoglycan-binding protein n=1 Tax=Solirubrobacter deserti TaxID=2282478 RepID=A0ABT4RKY0_9ACTN|nr:peptidoglycan-binding protein [Solirubrobacter deserti]MBE2319100.1 peptidoglycan-binding protein [Solirubrobacter deserti]MDA0139179.1 peptidoglycan-binding protein [Solirubrobacter deserti]
MRRSVVLVALVAAGCGSEAPATETPAAPRETATVERTDLVDRENLPGTLGFADPGTLASGVSGTLTGLRAPGTVVTRGHSLYAVDGAPAAFLLYGELPTWRDFSPSMTDGEDVRQLERNLRALGYDPGTVDDDWDWETTEAVEDFQRDRELEDDGTLSRGEIVFRAGATRIGEAKGTVGEATAPGRPVAAISSVEREVVVALDARRQHLAKRGATVSVELPTGDVADGRITDVGTVASQADEESDPTVEVTITLRGRRNELDQAPVEVGFAVEAARDALAVPVKALLARQGGGYALELPDGRKLPVETGLYADDLVEVSGAGVREGLKVVTAR